MHIGIDVRKRLLIISPYADIQIYVCVLNLLQHKVWYISKILKSQTLEGGVLEKIRHCLFLPVEFLIGGDLIHVRRREKGRDI